MNMKMNMEPIWSILKMIGYFLMELLVWIGTVLLHVTTFLLLFFVLRKVKNKPKIYNRANELYTFHKRNVQKNFFSEHLKSV